MIEHAAPAGSSNGTLEVVGVPSDGVVYPFDDPPYVKIGNTRRGRGCTRVVGCTDGRQPMTSPGQIVAAPRSAPRYFRVEQPNDGGGRPLFAVMCDEGWRTSLVADGLPADVADGILDVVATEVASPKASLIGSDQFYSPGKVMVLLWRYDDLVRLTGSGATDDSNSQRLPRETPEGGFEAGAAIQADLDWALDQLEPLIRRVVVAYYIQGYPAVSVAKHLPGANRWFVDRARYRGVRQMAESLHWKPRPPNVIEVGEVLEQRLDRECQTAAELRERTIQIVARGLNVCPRKGPPGYACPVIECRGWFDHEDGLHEGAPRIEMRAA